MSPIAFAAAATNNMSHGLLSRWTKCGRNFQLVVKWIGGVSAIITVLSFLSAHARAFVHDEVVTQVIPIVEKIDDLHHEVITLRGNMANVASVSEINGQLTAQLGDIKTLLQSLQKTPSAPNKKILH